VFPQGAGTRAPAERLLVHLSRPAYVERRILQGEAAMPEHQAGSEANRLYWETDASVGEIADQLAMSRRALYDAIEPRPAGVACTECGVALVFRNRTAMERRRAECLECEIEQALEAAGVDMGAGPARPETAAGPIRAETAYAPPSPVRDRGSSPLGSGVVLGGSLLAGLALGAAAGYVIRKR
jgi:hypothetical protein